MSRNGVVITGRGLICSAGTTLDVCIQKFLDGTPCLQPVSDQRLITMYGPHFAGLVAAIPPDNHSSKLTKYNDRFVQLAAAAATEMVVTCGKNFKAHPERNGIIIGTCSGPMNTIEEMYKREIEGRTVHDASASLSRQYYSASLILAERFGIKGPSFTVTTACSAFTVAAGIATDLIRIGMLDSVLVGGSDTFSATTQAGFNGLKATCKDGTCAPFSLPVGLNLGEGAGFLLLENKKSALDRSAVIYGEILGYGLSNDAWHCSAPDPSGKGAALAMQRALDDAGILPDRIQYINAHGTGTEANDKAETKAIRRIFGDLAESVKVSSLKAVTGHCLGAAGAVETVASLECIRNGFLPPTAHYSQPREGCALDYIPAKGQIWNPTGVMLKNNFAFGGNNASICISDGKHDQSQPALPAQDDPICISAIGIISAAGIGVDALREDRSPLIEERKESDTILRIAGVPVFNMSSIDRRIDTKGVDPETRNAIASAVLALSGARLTDKQKHRQDLGFIMNIAHGSTWAESEHIVPLLKNNFKLEQINVFPYIVPNSITGTISRTLSLTGFNSTFCNGPGAGLIGLMLAWVAIRNNHASSFLCGSSDWYSRGVSDCICAEKVDPQDVLIGEGSAMFVIERRSAAQLRGIQPICTIESGDCYTAISTEGSENDLQNTIKRVVDSAGIEMRDIGVVSCSLNNNQKKNIEKLIGKVNFIDISSVTGFAPSSQPLFNLAAAIVRSPFVGGGNKNYILAVSSAYCGNNCAMVVKNNS